MKCPQCQFENPEDAKFCNECGSKLEIVCSEWGKTNKPGGQRVSLSGTDKEDVTMSDNLHPQSKYITTQEQYDHQMAFIDSVRLITPEEFVKRYMALLAKGNNEGGVSWGAVLEETAKKYPYYDSMGCCNRCSVLYERARSWRTIKSIVKKGRGKHLRLA